MRWTIGKRIFTALTVTSLLVVALNAAATRWSFQRGFNDYLSQQEAGRLSVIADKLAKIYARDGSWETLRADRRLWDELFRDHDDSLRPPPRRPESRGRRPPPRDSGPPPPDPLDLRSRVVLLDHDDAVVVGRDIRSARHQRLSVVANSNTIGALLVAPQLQLTEQVDLNFASEQSKSIVYIGAAVLLLAAAIAAVISQQLVRPIATLTSGTKALAAGEFEKRITVARDDELGDLARDFNTLAERLQTNQQMRRRWVSDISHELRTPLAILNGELQAIEDGLRRFDEGTRNSLQAEVNRLNKLVSDLHELTLSDEGGLQYAHETIDVVGILRDALDSYQLHLQRGDVELRLEISQPNLFVSGDSARLDQLFTNLMENSVRYTNSPGVIEVGATGTDQQVTISFADSAPGVREGEHKRVFDRLYRADGSRNRASGGSGLGLSICKAIVESHFGEIAAEPSPLGGLSIRVTLPRLILEESQT